MFQVVLNLQSQTDMFHFSRSRHFNSFACFLSNPACTAFTLQQADKRLWRIL
ncbi:Uncharacterised protein [Shigella sonnei]|nr:Uncharacterised protein [Shigella sonnei]